MQQFNDKFVKANVLVTSVFKLSPVLATWKTIKCSTTIDVIVNF